MTSLPSAFSFVLIQLFGRYYTGEQDVSLSSAGMPVSVLTWTAQLSTKSNGHAYQ